MGTSSRSIWFLVYFSFFGRQYDQEAVKQFLCVSMGESWRIGSQELDGLHHESLRLRPIIEYRTNQLCRGFALIEAVPAFARAFRALIATTDIVRKTSTLRICGTNVAITIERKG
jgi:hypothetical protein